MQKIVSLARVQLGSECQPGRMGFVYVAWIWDVRDSICSTNRSGVRNHMVVNCQLVC